MSNVIVGSASIDERGKGRGGKAGDQTGKEVYTRAWYKYKHDGKVIPWRVFRPKSKTVADRSAYNMQAACNNPHIGYDQNQRNTLYNAAKKVGFDCAKVTTDCETDCSALIRVCIAYAGINVASFNTANEPQILLNTGEYVELTGAKYTAQSTYLRRGDILCTAVQGHTVMVLTDGPKAYADIKSPCVLVTGGSVYVRSAPDKMTGKILGVVYKNDTLPYQGETSANNWYLVEYKNSNGWISGKYSKLIT